MCVCATNVTLGSSDWFGCLSTFEPSLILPLTTIPNCYGDTVLRNGISETLSLQWASVLPLLQSAGTYNCPTHATVVYLYATCIHTYIRTYIYTYIHAYMHTYVRTYIHTYIHMYERIYLVLTSCRWSMVSSSEASQLWLSRWRRSSARSCGTSRLSSSSWSTCGAWLASASLHCPCCWVWRRRWLRRTPWGWARGQRCMPLPSTTLSMEVTRQNASCRPTRRCVCVHVCVRVCVRVFVCLLCTYRQSASTSAAFTLPTFTL